MVSSSFVSIDLCLRRGTRIRHRDVVGS
jgi:hypothetical protein